MKQLFLVLLFVVPTLLNAQDKCLSGDCQNGIGKLECECGYTFEGMFKDGKKVHGVMTKKEFVYEGDFKDDMAHGQGKITYKDGSSYEGTFAFSEPDGKGVFSLSNGFVYTGDIVGGYFNGWGSKTNLLKDSTIVDAFVGTFNADQLSGIGMHQYPDGVKEIGEFQKSKLHGLGVVIHPNGGIEVGMYKKGKLDEEYALTDKSGVQLIKELELTELEVLINENSGLIKEIELDTSKDKWSISFNLNNIEFYFNGQSKSFDFY